MPLHNRLTSLFFCMIAVPALAQTPISRELPAGVSLTPDLEYVRYADQGLLLDLYRPVGVDDALPVVVLIQGGGLADGNRKVFGPLAAGFAAHGLAAVSIDYRGAESAVFPATVEDVKAVVRWLQDNAETFGIRSDNIGLFGGSYGAQIALYGGLEYAQQAPGTIDAIVGFSSPADLSSMPASLDNFFTRLLGADKAADPALWQRASPVYLVSGRAPPLLLVASETDKTVPYQQSVSLAAAYQAAGASAEVVLLPSAHHAFWNYQEWSADTLDQAAQFFLENLQ